MSALTDTKFKAEYHGMVEPGVRMFWLVEGKVSLVAPATEDAKRVAACWNACAGIPTEALESGLLDGIGDKLQQRAELLAALERIAKYPSTRSEELGLNGLRAIACEAITKVEAAS